MSLLLANKYRPCSFDDVVGQDVIVKILKNQIKTNTFKNVYLFVGQYGTGKTTLARILANEINNGEGSPIEIDAASNNSVDNIRQIIYDAQQYSVDSKYKIFILDEVHSLTNQAWQAFLKCLEEPPKNSIFILCTTEVNKVPNTILSRAQRFDLEKISSNNISKRLLYILEKENINQYDVSGINKISCYANGHMRDAISLLEKCLDYGELTLENIELVLGVIKYDYMFDLLDCIINNDSKKAFEIVSIIKLKIDDSAKIFDMILEFLIDCYKYKTTRDLSITSIPLEYEVRIRDYNYNNIVNLAFKYRQLCLSNGKILFDRFIMELFNGNF